MTRYRLYLEIDSSIPFEPGLNILRAMGNAIVRLLTARKGLKGADIGISRATIEQV